MKPDEIKRAVRDRYGTIAAEGTSCCSVSSCCGSTEQAMNTQSISRKLGYSELELCSVPTGSNLGLGCGNPTALAALEPGEVVVDLGSGAGFDAFLAAQRVGPTGKVIGVDMTPEMVEKARRNAAQGDFTNVEFRLGEIEELPVADQSADVVISNCVINLAPDKPKVFRESFRVLKPGGRLMVSDLVLLRELPDFVKSSVRALTGCIAGALLKEDYLQAVSSAGFKEVAILEETRYPIAEDDAIVNEISGQLGLPSSIARQAVDDYVSSVKVFAAKP